MNDRSNQGFNAYLALNNAQSIPLPYIGEELSDFLKANQLQFLQEQLAQFPISDLYDLNTVFGDDINLSMLKDKLGRENFDRVLNAKQQSLFFMWIKARNEKGKSHPPSDKVFLDATNYDEENFVETNYNPLPGLGKEMLDLLENFRLQDLQDALEEFPIPDPHDLCTVFNDDINLSMLLDKLDDHQFNRLQNVKFALFEWIASQNAIVTTPQVSPTRISDAGVLMQRGRPQVNGS